MADPNFESPEIALFWRYINSSVERLVKLALELTPEDRLWRPTAEDSNSILVLAVHTIGNLEENILETLCGQPIGRDRAAEFAIRSSSETDLAERWRTVRERALLALSVTSGAELNSVRPHPRRGQITGRDVLFVVTRHAAEHLGQAELTRDLLWASRPAPN